MTKDQQAALEQVARDVLGKHYECEDCWYSCPLSEDGCCNYAQPKVCNCGLDTKVQKLVSLLAAQRAAGLEEALNRGEVWSFMRRVLSQGGDIQLDYNAGKYKCHEEYSARLDAAARERADQFVKEAQEQRP